MGISESVIRKDIKYSLISPFWLVTILDKYVCVVEVDFGIKFSNQIISRRCEDTFKLEFRVFCGRIRWIIGGKYPSEVENDEGLEVVLIERFMVRLFSSSAIANPKIEIERAVILRYQGIVRIGMLVGGMLNEIRNPAKMLPSARRLIGLIRFGLFSFMIINGV